MPKLIQLRTTRSKSGSAKEETNWEGNQLENKISENQLRNQLVETSPEFSNQLGVLWSKSNQPEPSAGRRESAETSSKFSDQLKAKQFEHKYCED
ncbi:hypothetical protein F511_13176 [Dorcoceras hygrometricum]|uniref:Uncharacterized protein n=1 Tax=Dorcoceras hygrometricum TaxID=472368 RepID=A0A2Z7BN57_9LAMI|nr:hypothetical protein F511_13176 [Dorcoceras hygrometricum]